MSEFIAACTQSPVNLTLSVLLLLLSAYWGVVLLGAVDIDSLDFDFDLDTNADAGSGGLLNGPVGEVLRFFNVGSVPVLVLASIMIVMLWAIGVLTWPLVGQWGILAQLAAFVPIWIGALLLTKLVTLPLRKLFEQAERQVEAENNVNLQGRRCVIISLTADAGRGQAEITTSGAPLRINVRTRDENAVLNKGDEAVIVTPDPDKNLYYIQAF